MELTKEYFDEVIKGLSADLKQYVMESFETQQVYINERFKEVFRAFGHPLPLLLDKPRVKPK